MASLSDKAYWRIFVGALLVTCGMGVLVAMTGCAHGVTGAYQTEANVANSTDAAIKGFMSFDHDYEIALGDKSNGKTPDQRQADLKAYRVKRIYVNKAFADANAALSTGHALLPLVESGIKKQTDMNAWLSQLLAAAQEVQQALAAVGVNLGGVK